MPNTFNIERAFKMKAERGWDTLYVAIDLHATLIKPYHGTIEFYPGAVEVMAWFNARKDFKTILWTSSHDADIAIFLQLSKNVHGIKFDFINENPLEMSNKIACFGQKFYFNILLDDKAGFDGETDWLRIKEALIAIGEW